jgi:hypothetical protein
MKIAILYNGLFNTFKMCKDSHKEYIFNYLDKNNIDYDVYINITAAILMKTGIREKTFHEKINKLETLFENFDIENDIIREGDWQLLRKNLSKDTVKQHFYEIIPREKIKSFQIDNDKASLTDCIHYFSTFPKTNFFKREKDLKIQINNENYSHFINIRPDFKITQNLDFDKFFNTQQDYIYISYRIDFLTVSNKMVSDIFTEENINLINNDESLINLEKNSIFKNNIHFEICAQEIFEKLNILPLLQFPVGFKMDLQIL